MTQTSNTYSQREGIRELTNEEIAAVAGGIAVPKPQSFLSLFRDIVSFFSSLFHPVNRMF